MKTATEQDRDYQFLVDNNIPHHPSCEIIMCGHCTCLCWGEWKDGKWTKT